MSNGPITPEGKAKSAANSLKHGLNCSSINNLVLATERQEDLDILIAEYIQRFHPANTPELELVHQMISARWRLRRLRSMETEIFDMRVEEHGMFNKERHEQRSPERKQAVAFQSLANTTQTLTQLSRYEARLERSYDRAFESLNKLRALPPPPETEPQPVESPEPVLQNEPTIPIDTYKRRPEVTDSHSHETAAKPQITGNLESNNTPQSST
jgi:hypothetical protein